VFAWVHPVEQDEPGNFDVAKPSFTRAQQIPAFTAREDFPLDCQHQWLDGLPMMGYANPKHRKIMDWEGRKKWNQAEPAVSPRLPLQWRNSIHE
jgi:hypothetical protein